MPYPHACRIGCVLGALGLLAAGKAATPGEPAPPDRPNIVFLFTDDHAAQAISAYGSEINQTPHLDRLARDGVLFRNCFCENSICAPSRAAILTGAYSHEHGVTDNRPAFDGSQVTLPKLLREAGYTTAIFGKWHLKTDPTGFDEWAVYRDQGRYYRPLYLTADGPFKKPGYSVHVNTDMGLDFLRRQAAKQQADGGDGAAGAPFLLMLQFKAPHRNWMPPVEYLDLFEDVDIPEPPTLFDDYEGRASGAKTQEMEIDRHMTIGSDLKGPVGDGNWHDKYNGFTDEERAAWDAAYGPRNDKWRQALADGLSGRDLVRWKYQRYMKDYLRCVQAVDDAVGRVLDELDTLGLAENTIVMYSSDQGFYLGEHGWFDKRWMYEESLRMPLIVRWPGMEEEERGRVETRMVQNIDFAPTMLDAADVEAPDSMRGRSFAGLVTGEGEAAEPWRDAIYYRYYGAGWHAVVPHFGVRTERYKLIRYPGLDEWELFDLEKDPDELRSVWGDPAYAAEQERLEQLLWKMQKEAGDTPEGVEVEEWRP